MEERFKLWRSSEFDKVPAIRWQVDGVLPLGGVSVMHGPPKTFKTYMAQSMALSCTAKVAWQGLKTRPAKVLYIGAEGFYGLIRRQRAWEQANTTGPVDIAYWRFPVKFFEGVANELRALEEQQYRPNFVIIDTLQRASVGADENSVKDMGRVFDNIRKFFEALVDPETGRGPTGLIVHHDNKAGGYRGSSAIFGDPDAMFATEVVGGGVTLRCDACRDGEPFNPFKVVFHPAVNVMTEDGWQTEVAVRANVTPEERMFDFKLDEGEGKGAEPDKRVVVVALGDRPLRNTALGEKTGLSANRLTAALKALVEEGTIELRPDLAGDKREKVYGLKGMKGGVYGSGSLSPEINSCSLSVIVTDSEEESLQKANRTQQESIVNSPTQPPTNSVATAPDPQYIPESLKGALTDDEPLQRDRLAYGPT